MTNPNTSEAPISFSFGKNWEAFVEQHYSPERLSVARRHLLDFLGLHSLAGKSFLDIGCGSGIHSLAAFTSDAAQLTSFDLDPASVSTTRKLRELHGSPAHWTVHHGSILDETFLATIPPADIVYSWGVLHHTGQMWKAIENASHFLAPGSLFYIALYQTTPRTPYWIDVKKRYNAAGPFQKRLMEYHYVLRHVLLPDLIRFRNPFSQILGYEKNRGMDFMTDIRDWLGGYPYEDSSIPETLHFGVRKLGLHLTNISIAPTLVEYLFEKPR
ncbi:MAG: class I SAM-dependent methyltransferase [Bryobacter sp.]|nr:class I SAM-dependent methyltransferase [Bryobacter sp.]